MITFESIIKNIAPTIALPVATKVLSIHIYPSFENQTEIESHQADDRTFFALYISTDYYSLYQPDESSTNTARELLSLQIPLIPSDSNSGL